MFRVPYFRRFLGLFLAACAIFGVFSVVQHRELRATQRDLEHQYERAFARLAGSVEAMEMALTKEEFADSPALATALCSEVYAQSQLAASALGELPLAPGQLAKTADFLSQAGDYAFHLSRSAAAGTLSDPDTRANLHTLAATATVLSQNLEELQTNIHRGDLSLEELFAAETLLDRTEDGAVDAAGGFNLMEQEFPELPVLIYDGPFSQHLGDRGPKALLSLPQVSREEARQKAADFLDLRESVFSDAGELAGDLPAWCFEARSEGGSLYLEVSKQGGQILSLFHSRAVGDIHYSPEDGLALARDFLGRNGFSTLQESYWHLAEGILSVNFAHREGEVLCYPDLIKVQVSLDTGSILGYEAKGWLMNHGERDLPAPALSADEAASILSPDLRRLSHQLCVIPSAGEYELLCYEFRCSAAEDRELLIYVNAVTGQEERILLLLEDENGTLTQ